MTCKNENANGEFAIRFKLRDIDNVSPWGEPGKQSLHWFALSEGVYCIDTPAGRLLERTGEFAPDLGEPWCDYYVVRLFEDLCEIWPDVRAPVPTDIADRYFAWDAREGDRVREGDDDRLFGIANEASTWWHARRVDFSYLRAHPKFHLWRTGAEVHLDWTADEPWLPSRARLTLPFESVHNAVVTFVRTFLSDMDARVRTINSTDWQPRESVLDVARLVAEHPRREAWAETALSDIRETDWDLIRRRLDELGA
jgi:hypothetical protein